MSGLYAKIMFTKSTATSCYEYWFVEKINLRGTMDKLLSVDYYNTEFQKYMRNKFAKKKYGNTVARGVGALRDESLYN